MVGEWIEHDGRSRPVPKGTLVLVRFRDGKDEEEKGFPPSHAGYWDNSVNPRWSNWNHDEPDECDIVAYKIVEKGA